MYFDQPQSSQLGVTLGGLTIMSDTGYTISLGDNFGYPFAYDFIQMFDNDGRVDVSGFGTPEGYIELALSDRELEIFHMLVEGKCVSEIANQLFISDKTVSTHKKHLLGKLGLKNVAELVRYAMQYELFS